MGLGKLVAKSVIVGAIFGAGTYTGYLIAENPKYEFREFGNNTYIFSKESGDTAKLIENENGLSIKTLTKPPEFEINYETKEAYDTIIQAARDSPRYSDWVQGLDHDYDRIPEAFATGLLILTESGNEKIEKALHTLDNNRINPSIRDIMSDAVGVIKDYSAKLHNKLK